MALTNRGVFRIGNIIYRGATPPTNFNLMLFSALTTPTVDTNLVSELSEIPAGNGYTSGGVVVARNSTDFDTATENDTNDRAEFLLKDYVFTASGGNLPASGLGARYVALVDDNATIANREVWQWWDLGSNVIVSDGQPLTLPNIATHFLTT